RPWVEAYERDAKAPQHLRGDVAAPGGFRVGFPLDPVQFHSSPLVSTRPSARKGCAALFGPSHGKINLCGFWLSTAPGSTWHATRRKSPCVISARSCYLKRLSHHANFCLHNGKEGFGYHAFTAPTSGALAHAGRSEYGRNSR